MSLFPCVDAHIATISQPDVPPKDKASIGRRYFKSIIKRCGFVYDIFTNMIRYLRRHRTYSIFWSIVALFICSLLYISKNTLFLNDRIHSIYDENDADTIKLSENSVVKRSYDRELPVLPNQAPLRVLEKPLMVHFLWCGRRVFEFKHYLAIKSAYDVLKPYKIIFHHVELPLIDTEKYFLWFNQTLNDIPDIIVSRLDRSLCPSVGSNRFILIFQLLAQYGGIYVPDSVMMLDFPRQLRTSSFATNVRVLGSDDYQEGIIVAKSGAFRLPENSEELSRMLDSKDSWQISKCIGQNIFEKYNSVNMVCLVINNILYPKDIWHSNSKFALLSRVVAYQKLNLRPDHDLRNPFPKIAHYICVDDCELEFIAYVSVLSSLFVAKLDRVYLHGPSNPTGIWWDRLSSYNRVMFVQHSDESFKKHNVHESTKDPCPLRVEILLRYGGIYLDKNVLWTNEVPEYYFGYSAVVSPDWHIYGSWPDSINPSILMGKYDSEYLIRLSKILKTSTHTPLWFNDHYGAYRLLELQPNTVFLDRRLQVKCINHNCHPTWLNDYRVEMNENRSGGNFNWRNDTLSVHWMDDFPTLDPDMVKYLSGIPVEIARYVFRMSDIDINSI